MRSAASSRPIERRTRSGETPSSYWRRHSARDSTPPSEVASLKRRSRCGSARAMRSVRSSTARTQPTPRGIWRASHESRILVAVSARWTATTEAPPFSRSHAASASAEADCRATRSSSVLSDRNRSHVSSEPGTPPSAARRRRNNAVSSASLEAATTTPASASECPASALVAECTTSRAPEASGNCSGGGASVASTTTSHSLFEGTPRASAAYAATSASSAVGFLGVSSQQMSPGASGSPSTRWPSASSVGSGATESGAPVSISARATSCVPWYPPEMRSRRPVVGGVCARSAPIAPCTAARPDP
mmetsp:Transcript_7225/g.30011  ORF Transcript_7225/g.30011 Transcript_7225/m.30011 type:complete len:305 (+) Transcript_7225:322-1236(+)